MVILGKGRRWTTGDGGRCCAAGGRRCRRGTGGASAGLGCQKAKCWLLQRVQCAENSCQLGRGARRQGARGGAQRTVDRQSMLWGSCCAWGWGVCRACQVAERGWGWAGAACWHQKKNGLAWAVGRHGGGAWVSPPRAAWKHRGLPGRTGQRKQAQKTIGVIERKASGRGPGCVPATGG